jgi:type 1 glutamine amidotransferase
MKKTLFLIVLILGSAFVARGAERAQRVVFMIGEDQYQTSKTLPVFAEKTLKPGGFEVTIVNADAVRPSDFPGLEAALRTADLLVISVRRRTPPREQLDAVRAYLAAGKPLVAIRTACHAFALRPRDKLADPALATWQEFDAEVLGGHYTEHHKAGPMVTVVSTPAGKSHPILKGVVASDLTTTGSLYKVGPLATDTAALLMGSIADQPPEPLAWTRSYGPNRARVFFTSLGTPDDFKRPAFQRLLLNGMRWAAGKNN